MLLSNSLFLDSEYKADCENKIKYLELIESSTINDNDNTPIVNFEGTITDTTMVIFDNKIGWIYGFSGGENGKECVIRDINGENIRDSRRVKYNPNVSFSKLTFICHNNNWQYQVFVG